MHRSLFVDFLVVLFGIGTWVCVNGLWVELPLLVAAQPEGWKLPSFMSVVIQLANIGPLLYTVLHLCYPNCMREKPVIYLTLTIGCASTILLSLFWHETTFLFGQQRSTALLSLVFTLALVDCSSRVLFLPFMAKFKEIYLTSFFIGEGLSGFVPSIFALIQGVGGNPTCKNVSRMLNGTDEIFNLKPVYSDPLFSVHVFFYILCGIMIASSLAFHLLNYPSIVKDTLAKKTESSLIIPNAQIALLKNEAEGNNDRSKNRDRRRDPSPVGYGFGGIAKENRERERELGRDRHERGSESLSEPITEYFPSDDSSSDVENSLAVCTAITKKKSKLRVSIRPGPVPAPASDQILAETQFCGDDQNLQVQNRREDENDNENENNSSLKNISKVAFVYLLGVQLIVSGLANGVFPSIQSYSCLPYGNVAYHWAVVLSSMANPVVCFLIFYVPSPTKVSVSSFSFLGFGVGAYIMYTAVLSPNPPFVAEIKGEIILVSSWILLVAFFTYVKVSVALVLRCEGRRGLFWCGALGQFGSAVGAISTFLVINYTHVFEGYQPCQ